ncbi:MAG TPA: long-chain fatty acid--CoA ligase, partial [Polyangiaceae bacterium]|nr:long-chain fatty acid--CoA ligase [Polyangiaceae bacterium]
MSLVHHPPTPDATDGKVPEARDAVAFARLEHDRGQQTVAEMFLERVARTPQREAYSHPTEAGWQALTWSAVGERVRAIASGLRALGLEPEQRCAILSTTRLEWILADLGVLCAGGATTTIYPASTVEECAFILADADCRYAFVEDGAQLAKLIECRTRLPQLRHVIRFGGEGSDDGWVITLAELMRRGRALDAREPEAYERIARSVRSDGLATLIYTSGTTGQPKGVELTHDAWVYVAEAVEAFGIVSADDRQYLWLPLAHAFGKAIELLQLRIGFSSAIDGDVGRLADNLSVVRPTYVCGVPRMFEKIYHRVLIAAQEEGKLKYQIFRMAFAVGRRAAALRHQGKPLPRALELADALADRLVFRKLRERFGGQLRFFICGGAALSREIVEFFHAAKVLVLEGYGLTESSAISCGNAPHRYRLGSVGLAMPGTEIKTATEDGEVLIRGRGVMRRYHNLPEATRAALTEDGWLRTGDIGRIDEDGFLFITDRKKDLIKTAHGKYVAPQALEGKLKASCPLISQVFAYGDNRSYVTALVTLDEEATRLWAKSKGLPGAPLAGLVESGEVRSFVQSSVDQVNRELARHEAIRRFAILGREFSQEAGE